MTARAPALVVYTTAPWRHALSVLRFRAPAEALGWRVLPGKEGADTIFPARVAQADAVLIQRDFPRFYDAYQQVVALAHRLNKPLIYDLDDLLLALPEEHPACRTYQDALGGMLTALLQADRVAVSSSVLLETLRPLRPDAVLWPTVLPDSIWAAHAQAGVQDDHSITLGYVGGATHVPDVDMLSPVLSRLLDAFPRITIRFWGVAPPPALGAHPRVRHVQQEVQSYRKFAASLRNSGVDIWIAPLRDTLFNRCKSAIKFWEYSALGGAAVYSRMEPYSQVVREGENGLLAAGAAEWEAALRRLIEDAPLRARLSQGARATLNARGWLRFHLAAWEALYTAPPPGTGVPQPVVGQVLLRFAAQVQARSVERHVETLGLLEQIAAYRTQLTECTHQLTERSRQLTERTRQLAEIFNSRSWRTLQRLNKWRRLDFAPLEPPPSLEDLMRENRT